MSGKKNTRISVTERMWNGLQSSVRRSTSETAAALRRAQQAEDNARRRVDEVRRNMDSRMDRITNSFNDQLRSERQERNRRLDAMDKAHKQNMKQMKKDFADDLKQQESRFDSKLLSQRAEYISMFDDQRREFDHKLDVQRNQLQLEMEKQKTYLESEIQGVHNRITQKETNERKQAEFWVEQTDILLQNIEREYKPNKFNRGNELNQLKQKLNMSKENFNKESYQASLSVAQSVFLDGELLLDELELLEREWQDRYNQAMQSVEELLARCESNKNVTFEMDTEEGIETYEADINYWTEGELAATTQEANEALDRLKDAEGLSLENLTGIMCQAEILKHRCDTLVEESRQSIISSQMRTDVADTIVDTLESQGWDLVDHTFEGDDQRGSYFVKMENGKGDKVLTVVEPSSENVAENNLHVSFYDEENPFDESSRRRRYTALADALKEEGLDLGEATTEPGYENKPADDQSALDLQSVKKRQASLPRARRNQN